MLCSLYKITMVKMLLKLNTVKTSRLKLITTEKNLKNVIIWSVIQKSRSNKRDFDRCTRPIAIFSGSTSSK